jgi:hypothetical protein
MEEERWRGLCRNCRDLGWLEKQKRHNSRGRREKERWEVGGGRWKGAKLKKMAMCGKGRG